MTSKDELFEQELNVTMVYIERNGVYYPVPVWMKKDLEVLEILKKKEVAIDELKNCIKNDSEDRPALEEYNDFAGDKNSLTQEEFTLIKEELL